MALDRLVIMQEREVGKDAWERQFIRGMTIILNNGKKGLTSKQANKVFELYRRRILGLTV